jgi:hypothetical protein
MRESLMYGSVRGARGNSRPYRDVQFAAPAQDRSWHQATDCRASLIRSLSEDQRTCRELVGRVDPTLLTHLGSGVCVAAVEMMVTCVRGRRAILVHPPPQRRIATRSSVITADRSYSVAEIKMADIGKHAVCPIAIRPNRASTLS